MGNTEQYSRRNNIAIKGIPTNIADDKLEEKVIKVLKKINVAVSPDEIEATHRLGKTKENTIAHFISRKISSMAIVSRKKLKGQKLFIEENSCPFLSKIRYMGRKL